MLGASFGATGNCHSVDAVEEEGRVLMDRMLLRPICLSALLAAAMFWSAGPLHAQTPGSNDGQSSQQQPSSKGYSSSATKQAEADSGRSPEQTSDPHKYDRYNAERDIEVADFYMHKGDPDAAIPRLEEASRLQPNYGKPRLLLAECYEKKHEPDNAVKYLKEYLKAYPHAPDAKKIQKKIEQLEKQ
jgi:tetratricopeptide (TPR) repeat protein